MSGASEQAIGRASGPVLQSEFLIVLAHSECKNECGKEMAATNYKVHKREACPFGNEGATFSRFKVRKTWLFFFCIQGMKKEFF